MSFKKPFLTLFLLYFLSTAFGQEGELQYYQNGFYVKQFSETAGLVNSACKNLYQDSRGFLWVSTYNGLSRFDGKQFVNYGVKEGLPGFNITQVSEDSSGLIYVATTTGIARYTGYNKSSDSYFYTYPQTTHLAGHIEGMQPIDSNTIIFQKSNGAVYLLKKNKLLELTTGVGVSSDVIYRNGNRYFYFFVSDTMRVFNSRFENVKNLFSKQLPYSTWSMDRFGSINIYSNGTKQRINNGQIVDERPAPDSIWWFANTDTLNSMVYVKESIIYSYDGRLSLPVLNLKTLSLYCNKLMQAKDGSIWVASSGGGLFRITALPYKSMEVQGTLSYYYKNGNRIVYDHNAFNKNKVFAQARDSLRQITSTILIDRKGNAWFCTDKGLYKQPASGTGHMYTFHGDTTTIYGVATGIHQGVELKNGDLWFYGNCGVVLFKNDEFKHYTRRNGLTEDGAAVLRIFGDKDGNVLLLNHLFQLCYIAGDTILPALNAAGTHNFSLTTLTTDNKGYVWIAYNKMLYRLEKQATNRFAIMDSIMPSEINPAEIKAFNFDLRGNCWVNYAGGTVKVFFLNSNGHYEHTKSVTYTKDDGLASLGALYYKLCPDDKGNMLFIPNKHDVGTVLSFSIQNAMKRKQLEVPAVSIVGIEINHKKDDLLLSGIIAGRDSIGASIRLRYNENDIIFNYGSSSLSHPSNAVYKTMLEGYDDEWQATISTSVNYTNLPAGIYTFLVQAANINGIWGPVSKYPFIIRSPWYKAWWATLLWITLSVLIICLIFFIRLNAMHISHLKESSVFKSDLIGLIGHDMVTPLLYIAKVSRQLRNCNGKLSNETTLESLGEIDTTATKLHFFGESIVHWIKVQNNDFKPVVEKFHVNKTIKELADFHHPLAAEKGNAITYEMHEDLFCYQDPTLVRIILHNLLLNANKFTVQGRINIAAIKENERLIITILDTGKGMDEGKVNSLNKLQPLRSTAGTNKEKGWGMGYKVIIEMLKFTGGALLVNSRLNEGTEVIINLPCRESEIFLKGYSEFPYDIKDFRN